MNPTVYLLSNGAPTRIVYNAITAIDLSLCSLVFELHWSIDTSLGASDRCQIYIHYEEVQNFVKTETLKRPSGGYLRVARHKMTYLRT